MLVVKAGRQESGDRLFTCVFLRGGGGSSAAETCCREFTGSGIFHANTRAEQTRSHQHERHTCKHKIGGSSTTIIGVINDWCSDSTTLARTTGSYGSGGAPGRCTRGDRSGARPPHTPGCPAGSPSSAPPSPAAGKAGVTKKKGKAKTTHHNQFLPSAKHDANDCKTCFVCACLEAKRHPLGDAAVSCFQSCDFLYTAVGRTAVDQNVLRTRRLPACRGTSRSAFPVKIYFGIRDVRASETGTKARREKRVYRPLRTLPIPPIPVHRAREMSIPLWHDPRGATSSVLLQTLNYSFSCNR